MHRWLKKLFHHLIVCFLLVCLPRLKPWDSSTGGWEGNVSSCFPSPVYIAAHARELVLPAIYSICRSLIVKPYQGMLYIHGSWWPVGQCAGLSIQCPGFAVWLRQHQGLLRLSSSDTLAHSPVPLSPLPVRGIPSSRTQSNLANQTIHISLPHTAQSSLANQTRHSCLPDTTKSSLANQTIRKTSLPTLNSPSPSFVWRHRSRKIESKHSNNKKFKG